ncbi:nucleotidyltransferase-like protein [Kribbella steppae]|uniref:Nucleotidyltransferase-like protein n=1 Tax=Kribbella steppae TaxID=2512223 RepID=A0A4R2HX87_9ACTN|nr:nucleotidyltransferase domain-containing protein [Kribbella steppae]TCO34675.1 nucleotidyltransferase-like protein [Kribbella steppae]
MFFNEPFGGIIPGARGAVLAALLRTDTPLTGRQIHGLLSDDYSLWTVQEALKALTKLGLAETQTIGRAGVHTINEEHASVAPLRNLLDPVAALREAVSAVTDGDVQAVLLFGSIARGEATPDSDIDLAVIAPPDWDNRVELEDSVRMHLGNDCDVLVLTEADFNRLAASGEPVVSDILRDGVALIGTKPRVKHGAA